jgi:hypothetical protein
MVCKSDCATLMKIQKWQRFSFKIIKDIPGLTEDILKYFFGKQVKLDKNAPKIHILAIQQALENVD